ncbi:centrosomin isoform X3 [Episyrphus balteatus]|uniref:centrosomin isoform X3 n=1 Tax=Episyrphus balteatus TaxID=286459 RepID=UPI00248521CC|nr:centrosomin isoform X3 [Episyrphus balteatus]XP_055857207.1 centrosomin isoform X3 [Episyrphus balteatus]
MAGIFRSHSVSATPVKRTSLSPFCTSPGQLQDVTMDNSYAIGYRSPCVSLQQYNGTTSPAQGRSVREFEEQMASLRKENFNLKLRIYFIEESIPGYNQSNNTEGQETLMKQLIDTKVEMEILRKEIHEKQDLLKEAAQALNQMELIQKDTEVKSQAIIDDLNHKIQYLEMENKEMEKSQSGKLMDELLGRSDVSSNINAVQRIRELEGTVKQSEEKINDFQNQIHKLDEILTQRDQTIRECEDKVKELVFQNSELLEQLENKDKEIATAERSLRGIRQNNKDLSDENQTITDSLEAVKTKYLRDMASLKIYEKTIKCQQETIVGMHSQRLREELQDHKRQLADRICMLEENEEKLKTQTTQNEQKAKAIQKLVSRIESQQYEIDRLKKNNTSSSSHMKELTNITECSGLCRSLSDTETIAESSSLRAQMEKIIEQKDSEIRKLNAEVKKKTANLQNLVNKELWEKNREIERLTKLVNKSNSLPTSPQKESEQLMQSFTDVEYAQALENNKLLQKKVDILIQRLATTGNHNSDAMIKQLKNEVKEAKDEAERSERWRKECADVCSILTARLEELAGFLDSLLKHKDVLGALAADRRRAMRKAVDRSLDLSKSLNNMSLSITGMSMMDQSLAQISNLSEILDFSVVNKENKTFNSHEELHGQTIETLQAELKALKKELDRTKYNESKRDRRSLPTAFENQSESEAWSEPDRKVSLARIGLEEPRASNACKEERSTDSESELNQSRSKSKTQEKISQLETMISQKDEKILEIQCELVDADNRLKKENLRVIDMTKELKDLRSRNEDLHSELTVYRNNQGSGFDVNSLTRQLEDKSRSLTKIQDERDRITVDLKISELQVENMKVELEELKMKHEMAISQASDQEKQKLNELKENLTSLMEQKLKEQQENHEDTLARDWIAKCMYDEHVRQFQQLQKKLVEAESTIEYLTENEAEMKQTLIDNELSMRAIKKNLDETTLQASRAVLERTKALNEKLQLENRTQELTDQIQALEAEKNELVTKINSLEQHVSLKRKSSNHGSDISQSGYTSEEVLVGTGRSAAGGQRVHNSSPDLGIESDAGRVSSVELTHAHLSKLKTVELKSKQMIQEDEETNVVTTPSTTHDCAKVDQENAELRSKLIRTKRALQDTVNKLRSSNQRKEQVEKEIKSQILKTHNVLKNVRSNMENEL